MSAEDSLAMSAGHVGSAQRHFPGVLKVLQGGKRCGEFVCGRSHELTPDLVTVPSCFQVIKSYLIQAFAFNPDPGLCADIPFRHLSRREISNWWKGWDSNPR
jgi:hypothetical protein